MLSRLCILATALACLHGTYAGCSIPSSRREGFLKAKGTKLYLNRKEFREISFNKFDLFHQVVMEGVKQWYGLPAERAEQELEELGSHGFRIIRVMCSPFYSTWLDQAFFDPDPNVQAAKRQRFFERFDDMLDACDRHNIKIIASLMWHISNFADLGHHSLHEGITSRNSPARRKIREYIGAVVERYKDRTTIAMWELGNEWNLSADLQRKKGVIRVPGDDLRFCTPPSVRDERNNFTSDELAQCCVEIASFIKSIDKNHLVTSGHSSPRPAAMHLFRAAKAAKPIDWTKDTEQETIEYMKLIHPDPIDVVQVHFYEDTAKTYGKQPELAKRLKVYKAAADQMGKPLILGEIGLTWTIESVESYAAPEAIEHAKKLLDIVVECQMPLTLFWSYSDDRVYHRDKIVQWNMRYGRTDAILTLIENANKQIKEDCMG